MAETSHRFKAILSTAEKPLREYPKDNRYEIVTETYYFFRDLFIAEGFEEFVKPSDAYARLPHQTYIVRREDPRKIFKLFNDEASYEIGFENDRYANCAEWKPGEYGDQGLANAYLEGFTHLNSIVTLLGFIPDENADIKTMEDSIQNFYGLDRTKVRSFRGKISRKNVAFINLRIPGHLFPEEQMTESEKEAVSDYVEATEKGLHANPVMIHRTFKPKA